MPASAGAAPAGAADLRPGPWLLEHKRLLLKDGTIVDATIIEAPPTKND
jgi:hypothetical protein